MRYSPSEKLRIVLSIRQSRLPVAQAVTEEGADALKDQGSVPHRVWNCLWSLVEETMLDCALDCSELSPHELAVQFWDEFDGCTASESLFYRMLKENDPVKSPVYIVHVAEKRFRNKTTQPKGLRQTDLIALELANGSWYQLSTVLDDNSRYIVA